MAKDTYRTSFDIPLRFKAYLDGLNYGERRLIIEKLLDLLMKVDLKTNNSVTDLLISERLLLIEKETT